MKKICLSILYIFIVFGACAQTSDAEADAIINLLGVQKKEAVAKLVSATGKDSVTFWRIYDEYLKHNKELAKDRIKLYEQTAYSYGNMSSAIADSLARKYFQNRLVQEKNLEEYYYKLKKATNPVLAFEFYQAEVYLLTMVRASIMQQIPTYGEMKVAARKKE